MGFKIKREQCKTCIYHPDSPLDINALEAQIADPHMEGFFKGHRECHCAKRNSGICCRGFWDKHKGNFTMGQIAQRLGFVEFVT